VIDRDIRKARALLIEGNSLLRSLTSAQLKDLGVGHISHASRLEDARLALEEERFDIVLCSREFEDSSFSGQDLLDELRREQLLPHSTVFIMITAEPTYHQVMEAAEASLDGVLVRPFNAAALGDRLVEARSRKRELAEVLRALDAAEPEAAFARALTRFQERKPYWAWCGRLAAELLLRLERPADARKVFEALVAAKGAGWARLGAARALMAQANLGAARQAIAAVLADEPENADAHDLLGRALLEQSDFDGALEAYRRAAAITPGCILRAQHVGALAFYQGHPGDAVPALERAVERGLDSKLFDAQTLLLLALLRFDEGDALGVAVMREQLQRFAQRHPGSRRLRRMETAVKALGLMLSDKGVYAVELAQRLAAEIGEPAFDLEAALLTLALWARLPEPLRPAEAHTAMLERLAQRFCVSKAIVEVLYAAARRETQAVTVIRHCQQQLAAQTEAALALSLQDEHRGAVEALLAAFDRNHNTKLLDLAHGVLRRHAEHIDDVEELAQRCAEAARRWGQHSTHIAGIQRSGRAPGGLQIRA
jgi:DNA-binding response OmpR family regulator